MGKTSPKKLSSRWQNYFSWSLVITWHMTISYICSVSSYKLVLFQTSVKMKLVSQQVLKSLFGENIDVSSCVISSWERAISFLITFATSQPVPAISDLIYLLNFPSGNTRNQTHDLNEHRVEVNLYFWLILDSPFLPSSSLTGSHLRRWLVTLPSSGGLLAEVFFSYKVNKCTALDIIWLVTQTGAGGNAILAQLMPSWTTGLRPNFCRN